jgi:hypothetical protein
MKIKYDISDLSVLYQTAYTRDHTALFGGRHTSFSIVRAGILYLPTGRIVACDPLIGSMREPFIQSALPGRYPVDLSLGYDTAEGVERILFSRILFTKNEPIMWVKAFRESESSQEEGEEFGIRTASGSAAYMDQEIAAYFQLDSMVDLDQFLYRLVGNYRPRRSWLNHTIDEDHNVICYTSATTDRLVPTYFAIDDNGDVCLALTGPFL